LITGKTGAGKSFYACALAYEACLQSYKTRYFSASKLFLHFRMARGDGSYLDELQKLAKTSLLVVDDFGLTPLIHEDCLTLYDILEDRYHTSGTIITSQFPVTAWHPLLQDPTLAVPLWIGLLILHTKLILKEEIREENIKKIDVKPATKVWLFKRASCPVQVAGLTRIGWQLSPKFASRLFENQNKTKKNQNN